jgi:hypothetical protein
VINITAIDYIFHGAFKMQLFAAKAVRGCIFAKTETPVAQEHPLNESVIKGNELVYVKFIVFEWHLIYNNKQLTPADIRKSSHGKD